MKFKLSYLFLSLISLTSCSISPLSSGTMWAFDTPVLIYIYQNKQEDKINELKQIFSHLDKLTDNFNKRDINNIYTINNTNENVTVDPELYNVLELSFSSELASLSYFNPLCGSLSKKWKESLQKGEVLPTQIIDSELLKMEHTHLEFLGNNTVKRIGEAEIDLGAIAKGYALDKAKQFFNEKEVSKYLVDAGHSSILLGEKDKGKTLKVSLFGDASKCLDLKNCVISTSALYEQSKTINDVTYSHIINPKTGSAVSLHSAVIVISESGYLGDILSTDFINESLDSIKALEKQFNVKTIVFDNDTTNVSYMSESIEISK